MNILRKLKSNVMDGVHFAVTLTKFKGSYYWVRLNLPKKTVGKLVEIKRRDRLPGYLPGECGRSRYYFEFFEDDI